MQPPDPASLFVPLIERSGIQYMITGGVAAIVFGEPRLTHDVDLVVRLDRSGAARLVQCFPPGEFYVPPIEVIREESSRREYGHFNVIHTETMLKADFFPVGEDPLQAWGLEHRIREPLGALEAWVAAPEYVIVQKLRYFKMGGSTRHLRDIAWMLHVSRDRIDLPLLEAKVRELRPGAGVGEGQGSAAGSVKGGGGGQGGRRMRLQARHRVLEQASTLAAPLPPCPPAGHQPQRMPKGLPQQRRRVLRQERLRRIDVEPEDLGALRVGQLVDPVGAGFVGRRARHQFLS